MHVSMFSIGLPFFLQFQTFPIRPTEGRFNYFSASFCVKKRVLMIDYPWVGNQQLLLPQSIPLHKLNHVPAIHIYLIAKSAIYQNVERHDCYDDVLEDDQVFDSGVLLKVKLDTEEIPVVFVSFLAFEDYWVILSWDLVVHLYITNSEGKLLVFDGAFVGKTKITYGGVT